MRLALFGLCGAGALATSAIVAPHDAGSAVTQVWPPFVLVAGLLLVGTVADGDGLFRAAGGLLARSTRSGPLLYLGAMGLVVLTTAVLNLDTAVAFLTPVLVVAGRRRGGSDALLYGCVLLANAGSMFLPGSNLTNLIVLGHERITGTSFLSETWLPGLVSVAVTLGVLGVVELGSLRLSGPDDEGAVRVHLGLGVAAVTAVTVAVLVLRSPAPAVLGIGLVAALLRIATGRLAPASAWSALSLPVLAGLFGVAVALGTIGRAWSGPVTVLSHLDELETAAVAAACAVLVNNLPAASLLAAHAAPRPVALLLGLNLGPNLFVTGSLAWLLWLRAARSAGAAPSLRRAAVLGALVVPPSLLAAVGALAARGGH